MEDRIVAELAGVYGPYTGRWFASKSDTDIEHVVARSEAHDSGLCAACWFAARVIAVRQRYELTIDRREADALDQILTGCASTGIDHVRTRRGSGHVYGPRSRGDRRVGRQPEWPRSVARKLGRTGSHR